MSAMEEETKTEQAPVKAEESEAPAASSGGDKDEKMAEAESEKDTKEKTDGNAGDDTEDANEKEIADANDNSEDEEHNTNEGGGGKRTYNRHNNRSSRRHTPYGRGHGTRAVYQHDNDSDPKKRVYVGNLSWDVTWRELKDHMKTTGCEVTRADVMATPDGRSKGCGIVEFATAEGASRAVLTLNDTELLGRQIFVREDREDGSGGGYYAQQIGGGGGGYHQNYSSGGGGGGRFSSGGDSQSRRVYVGNLSWDVAWQDLKDHMRQAGEVAYAEVMTESDGRSKGCGIVEFASADEAQEAISTLTDTELKGRMIFVREDRETASGGGGGGGYHHGGGRHHGGYGSTSVYVGNLAYETSWQDLKDHMRAAGNVDQANILTSDDGRSKGCGIVQYQKPQEAARAIRELQNSELHGRPIFVREDREQGGGHHGGGGGGGGCQLFVGNLSYDTNWRDLKDHFRQCGDVERAEVMEAPDGRKKGFGTVRFYRQKDAQNAISRLNGVELQGRRLEVRIDHKA